MVSAGWHRDRSGRPHRARLHLEALEDRLAPSCTLPLIAQAELPFGIPVVSCAADGPVEGDGNVLRMDLSHPGLAGAGAITVVFHFAGTFTPAARVEYFDGGTQTWRPLQPSTRVADSLTVDAGRKTITLIFDESSTPALSTLDGRLVRLSDDGVLQSVVVEPPAAAETIPLPSLAPPAILASGFFDPEPPTAPRLPLLQSSGFGVADSVSEPVQPEVVIQTHTAFWTEAPVESVDPETTPQPPSHDSRPPMLEPEIPQFAAVIPAADLRSPAGSETCAEPVAPERHLSPIPDMLAAALSDARPTPAWMFVLAFAGFANAALPAIPRAPPSLAACQNKKRQTTRSAFFCFCSAKGDRKRT